jgi:hypothetical protein
MAKSIKVRGFELSQILSKTHGALELILSFIELEQQLEEAQETLRRRRDEKDFPDLNVTVEIEEFLLDNEGRLINNAITEDTWIDSICTKTGLDVRAIMDDLPKEVGLYAMKIAYKAFNELKTGTIRVWVMPVKS